MGLGNNGQKVFIRKSGTNGSQLYRWSPFDSDKKSSRKKQTSNYFCSTPMGTQGDDWIVTYTYNVVIVGAKTTRTAYVQCDYVV